MIGLESELAAVVAFLDSAPPGPRALVIEGAPGSGKTTLVREALRRATTAGLRTLVARPAAGELELPYVALTDLLSTLPDDAFANLAKAQQVAVAAAVGREESDRPVDEHLLARGVLELLRRESAGGDLVLVVDDAQWLDRPTATGLAFALRRLEPAPLRVLVALRGDDGAPAELPLGLAEWDDLQRIRIGPLSTTQLGALLRERLQVQLPRPRLNAIRNASGGNPLFALELARQGRSGQAAYATTLSAALEQRLAALDEESRTVLGFAAAALRPSTELLLRAGVERRQLEVALETSLLEAEGERLWFAHPLLGSAAYGLLEPGDRRRIHATLAAASLDAVERGHHVARSLVGRDDEAARTLDQAAEEAARLGDHAGAATFLLQAARSTVEADGEAAHERELHAAEELELAGDVRAAAALAQQLLARLPRGVARARARQTFVWASIGDELSYGDALAGLALAVEDAEEDGRVQAGLRLAMGEICCGLCRLDEAVEHTRAAIELAERSGDATTATAALAQLGFVESMLGLGVPESSRQALARWDGSVGAGSPPPMELACALLHATEFDEAEQLFETVIALAQQRGVEAVEVVARAHLAETQLRAGRWADAHANSRNAVEHARQAAIGQIVTGVSYALAMTQALLGQHDEARRLAAEALADAEATHDFWFRISHRAVLGLIALADDDPQAAVDVLEPAWRLMIEQGLGDLSIFPVAQPLAESLVAVGRLDDALAVAATLRASPVGGGPWCRAIAGRTEAIVASAQGDHAAARTLIAGALEAHDELPEPFEHARTLQLAGSVEHRARGWGAARVFLLDALDRFDELGAARWAEKTAAQIARLPGRRPTDKDALTTREREVAELVAAGLTNKEVAARLFLSLGTVEANLSKVYAKLAVRSRSELAGRLRR